MKKILGLLIILIVGFTSCEGRKTQRQALSEDIEEFKKDTIFEEVSYTPKNYNEVIIDTLLTNGFKVKIKIFSDMDNSALLEEVKKGNTFYKKYYREHVSQLEIFYNNKLLVSKKINKSLFKNKKEDDFWNKAILGAVTINELRSLENELTLNIYYCIPESEICKDFVMVYDEKGKYTIEELQPYKLP
jgi:hypothetical protein